MLHLISCIDPDCDHVACLLHFRETRSHMLWMCLPVNGCVMDLPVDVLYLCVMFPMICLN